MILLIKVVELTEVGKGSSSVIQLSSEDIKLDFYFCFSHVCSYVIRVLPRKSFVPFVNRINYMKWL